MLLHSRRALVVLTAFLFSGLLQQAALGQRPLPADQDLVPIREAGEGRYEFFMQGVDDYQECTTDPPAVREAAQDFLRHRYAHFSKWPGAPSQESLLAEGKAVIAAGSRDPLVLAEHAPQLFFAGDLNGAKSRFEESWQLFQESNYSARHRTKPAVWMAGTLSNLTQGRETTEEWAMRYAEMLAEWMIEQPDDAAVERSVWRETVTLFDLLIGNDRLIEQQQRLYDLVADNEDVDPWLREMVAGTYLYNLAWHHRGGGFANQVEEDGWEGFRRYLPQAGSHFRRAHELRPELPYAAASMIKVAFEGGDETPAREWFDRTVEAQLIYMRAYDSYLFSLRPRWGGSHAIMFEFGKECAATRRYDTDLPYYFIKVMKDIDGELGAQGAVWQVDSVYQIAKSTLENMAEDPSRFEGSHLIKISRVDLLSELAAIAVVAGELRDARNLLEDMSLPQEKLSEAFQNHGLLLERERSRIYAYTGPAKDVLIAVEEMLAGPGGGDLTPEERERLETMLVRSEGLVRAVRAGDDRTQPYIDAIRSRLAAGDAFDNGEWVDLPFDPEMSYWRIGGGHWTVQRDGSIIADSMDARKRVLLLALDIEVTEPFVMEFTVDMLDTTSAGLGGGLLVGNYTSAILNRPNVWHFFYTPNDHAVGFKGNDGESRRSANPVSDNPHVRVKVADGYYEIMASGRTEIQNRDDEFRLDNLVALGACFWTTSRCRIRFSDVRLRRWTEGPPPGHHDYEPHLEYYSQLVNDDPEDPFVWTHLANTQLFFQDYDGAAESFCTALELFPEQLGTNVFLGYCYQKSRQYEKAIKAYTDALEENADDTYSKNDRA